MERDRATALVVDAIKTQIYKESGSYSLDSSYKEVGADSLDTVKIAMIIENSLDGKIIADIDLNQCLTPADLITLLMDKY